MSWIRNTEKKFFCLLLFEGILRLHYFSKIKSQKEVTIHKAIGIKVFLTHFAWFDVVYLNHQQKRK
jgi:hypothetical protein